MSALARVQLLPEAKAELVALADPDVQRAVFEALLVIERDLEFGAPLGRNDVTGDLRGCRKGYVDKPTGDKPRYRLVYWLAPSEANPRYARVLAIGERRGLDAYALAVGRYNPRPGRVPPAAGRGSDRQPTGPLRVTVGRDAAH